MILADGPQKSFSLHPNSCPEQSVFLSFLYMFYLFIYFALHGSFDKLFTKSGF